MSIRPGLPAEAEVTVDYETIHGAFRDGEPYELRRPRYHLGHLGYGEPAPELRVSPRVAPQMIGVGLLEAIPESVIHELEDPDDRNVDGISGRANVVWDVKRHQTSLGRFGWKAEQPTVLQQSAAAFAGDMGITSSLFQSENHTAREEACTHSPTGGSTRSQQLHPRERRVLCAVAWSSRAQSHRRSFGRPRRTAIFARSVCSLSRADSGNGRRCGSRRAGTPDRSPLHGPSLARHGGRPRRWASDFSSKRARMANAAALGHRSPTYRQRPHLLTSRRPCTKRRRSHPLARRRSTAGTASLRRNEQARANCARRVPRILVTIPRAHRQAEPKADHLEKRAQPRARQHRDLLEN